jgi:hypothetical protein
MEIKKKSSTFDTYVAELSYGELMAMRDSLAKSHTGPVADDLYQGVQWHLEKLPKPGEDEDKGEEGLDGEGKPNNSLRSAADDLMTPDEKGGDSKVPDGSRDPEGGKKSVKSLADLDDELPEPPAD